MGYNVCILSNENSLNHKLWLDSVSNSSSISSYSIVNLTTDNWYSQLVEQNFDLFLLRPPGQTELFKRLYDERVLLISQIFKTPIYPSLNEVLIYENKRYLRDWLTANNLPHPKTFVFFNKEEANQFADKLKNFPIVGKTNIGASGNGVLILRDKKSLAKYINTAFEEGIAPIMGPKLSKGSVFKKIGKVLSNPHFLKQRLKDYKKSNLNKQYHFVIFQEYIPHKFEWRCVVIGDSYFAHKKIVVGDKSSGTLLKGYDPVPHSLLDFIRDVTIKHNLTSVAIDLFERKGSYLINEIQCFFGQSDPYQMLVEGKPGRYIYSGNNWVFEEGMFNSNENYDLRLKHALSMLK